MEVVKYLQKNKVTLFGMMETRVKISKVDRITQRFGAVWQFADNYSKAETGRL